MVLYKVLPILFLLSSCVTTQPKPVHPSSYGFHYSADECIKMAEEIITFQLKDPTSAIFRHNTCGKGYMGGGLFSPKELGYYQSGFVNAKNSYGGYTGFYKYNVLIRSGKIIYYCVAQNEYGICIPKKPRR